MILKLRQLIFFVLAIFVPGVQARSLQAVSVSAIPLHEVVISLGAVALLILGIIIYRQHHLEQRTVEFTVFNSQYIEKESTRSSSEHDFPNFDVDLSNEQKDSQPQSSERRRRRKADRLERARVNRDGTLGNDELKLGTDVRLTPTKGEDGQDVI